MFKKCKCECKCVLKGFRQHQDSPRQSLATGVLIQHKAKKKGGDGKEGNYHALQSEVGGRFSCPCTCIFIWHRAQWQSRTVCAKNACFIDLGC